MKIYKLYSKNIKEIPFHYLLKAETAHLLDGLAASADVILPSALEVLNREVVLQRNEDGLVSPSKTLATFPQLYGEEDAMWFLGLLKYLTPRVRGSILGKITQNKSPNYSTLVPLVLSAFKSYRKVDYSEWDIEDPKLRYFIDEGLYESITCDVPEFDKEFLINTRTESSIVRSGATAGVAKKHTAYFKIKNTGYTEFDALPSLVKVMLCQVWVAHPSVRTNLMILDPRNLDSVPDALEDEDVQFVEPVKPKEGSIWGTVPW